MWQSIKNFSSIPQIKTTNTSILTKKSSGIFPKFPEKLTLYAKSGQKWFFWDFEVLHPSYVTINKQFSSIPQIYTPNTTILTKKNLWKISKVSRKTYIVCKIGT